MAVYPALLFSFLFPLKTLQLPLRLFLPRLRPSQLLQRPSQLHQLLLFLGATYGWVSGLVFSISVPPEALEAASGAPPSYP